ncbi:unnamed protein product [Macrosiphum euphorbiae]|uniref:Uncharacterized protein n=1 Tax=Macrosiphum euphorbiae TaxID=13131 RepID=A0AAV0VY00_9HEMI|nr:unnamed protein product [Macrosiphum euphorbiae]
MSVVKRAGAVRDRRTVVVKERVGKGGGVKWRPTSVTAYNNGWTGDNETQHTQVRGTGNRPTTTTEYRLDYGDYGSVTNTTVYGQCCGCVTTTGYRHHGDNNENKQPLPSLGVVVVP